ncbi:MAG TPA: hypothetical protein VNK51_17675 [Bradyrhizobium sp.]|nr:hypothetical protein [Bradyrhizobium sp.]
MLDRNFNAGPAGAHMFGMERNIVFKCPRLGMNVQHWLSGAASVAMHTHVPVRCPACASLHFVSVASGRMLSEGSRQRRRYSSDESRSLAPRPALVSTES